MDLHLAEAHLEGVTRGFQQERSDKQLHVTSNLGEKGLLAT